MAYVKTVHHLNTHELEQLLNSPSGPVAKDLMRRGLKVASAAKQNLNRTPRRVNTGALRADIHPELGTVNGKIALRVGTGKKYAAWVHDGTGLYGPRHAVIRPKTKKALRWHGKTGKVVFARYSRGMRPNPFLRDALRAARG